MGRTLLLSGNSATLSSHGRRAHPGALAESPPGPLSAPVSVVWLLLARASTVYIVAKVALQGRSARLPNQ